MQKSDEIELVIVDVGYGGRGVGRVDGCVVFVPGTIAGERVTARITSARKRFSEAELIEVVEPSPERVEPKCPLVGECPGCSYQHVAYDEEVRLKQAQFESLLKRMGGVSGDIYKPPVPSPRDLGYRNKIVLHLSGGSKKALGYVGFDNRTVLDVAECPLAVPLINERLAKIRSDPRFMEEPAPGSTVSLRWSKADGVRAWSDRAPRGDTLREETPLGVIDVPLRAFFQVNPWLGGRLVTSVAEIVQDAAPSYVLDLFCGVGLFGMAAAKAGVPHVLGVERLRAAVRAANDNSSKLELRGVEFKAADVEEIADSALERTPPEETLAIVDPPRQGLGKQIADAFVRHRPATLVYVSCAPDTLARDIARLKAGGYEVMQAQLMDMFPRTAHFESVTVLKWKN